MKKLIPITASLLCVAMLVCSLITPTGSGQELAPVPVQHFQTAASNLIIPQARSYAMYPRAQLIQISDISADIRILQQVATTTLEIGLSNPTTTQQEAEMLVPIPDGAVVRSFETNRMLTGRICL